MSWSTCSTPGSIRASAMTERAKPKRPWLRFLRHRLLAVGSVMLLVIFLLVLLAIGIAAALGSRTENVVAALAIVYTPRTARIVRASTLVLREMAFVEAAVAVGASHVRILARHIVPNCIGPIAVQASFIFAYAVLSEAVMSYLCIGPPPPGPT